ncbi:MAG: four helix bundle protein [Gemmatimonadales bacterium]
MPYEKLKAWNVSHELAIRVYCATKNWPREELYGLTSQTRRAALSVPTNLAEGSAKRTSREFRRYLDTAVGSLAELSYLLRAARDLELMKLDEWEAIEQLRSRAGQLTWRLYESLGRKIRTETARS